MTPPILFLIAGTVGFAGVLCAAPYLLIRAICGPIHDPEHIGAHRYADTSRESEGCETPDMRANSIGIGTTGEVFTHLGERI